MTITTSAPNPMHITILENLSSQANKGCGLSYELFCRKFDAEVNAYLPKIPQTEHHAFMNTAKTLFCYDDTDLSFDDDRSCPHGIQWGCCPAGCDVYDERN